MPSFRAALRTWAYVAAHSFGGPAGQIAVMHRVLVEEKRWISEGRFLHALSYCTLLPGPEAQQLATYVGWLMHGTRGGLAAGLLFVFPGFLSILGLSVLYVTFGDMPGVEAVLFGVKAAVLAVVVEAVVRVGRRALRGRLALGLAVAAFVALFFFAVPFPLVVLVAGLIGYVGGSGTPASAGMDEVAEGFVVDGLAERTRPSGWGTLQTVSVWLLLWLGPLALLAALLGREDVLVREGLFFSQTAVVTFGGAYSVLAYVAQEAVGTFGWVTPEEMLDGLGLAETTPGPLIQVVQFVGFLGAYRQPGVMPPLLAGVLGSVVTAWATFAPCFLWIFAGAPYVERLRANRRLAGALAGITAAVVGVILNLALWFALHVLFARVREVTSGRFHVWIPDWTTLDPLALALAAFAFFALFRLRWGMLATLGACAALCLAARLLG